MPISVTKYGPYFSNGSISFGQLRNNFAERNTGIIRASDLRRNTDVTNQNPIVPDSTENEQISTDINLKLSQFRNSIKRYVATQTGTDDNTNWPNQPGLRLLLYDPDGRGIDWSGGGPYGRDGIYGPRNGNHFKNVQKGILITGTAGSVRTGLPAAQMSHGYPNGGLIHNVRIDISGSILGYGGNGGGNWYNPAGTSNGDLDGENGGIGLNLNNIGYNNRIIIGSGCRIYGGGGGGERGMTGLFGYAGVCKDEYTDRGCGFLPPCAPLYNQALLVQGSCCDNPRPGPCRSTYLAQTCVREEPSTPGVAGRGGRGGHGRGYNWSSSLSGEDGAPGTCPTCSFGGLTGGRCGEQGGRGGSGGEWGEDGEGTGPELPGTDRPDAVPGAGGKAIQQLGPNRYSIYGSWNANNIKGGIEY